MSQENVEVARKLWVQLIERSAARNATGTFVDPAWDPDVEYVEDPRWPGGGSYRGADAIQDRFAEYLEIFGAVELSLKEMLDGEDDIVSIFRARGVSAQTGLPFEHDWAYVWTFHDGRVVKWRAYFDKAEALEAVGMSE
jgi:ketosteroid isomerase-like protein